MVPATPVGHGDSLINLPRKIVPNLIRLDTHGKTKASLRLRRKGAAWDDDLRMNMLGMTTI